MEVEKAIDVQKVVLWLSTFISNIAIATFIFLDLLKNKIKSIPVILLSLMSYFAGTILFLFLINNKINSNDKQ